MRHYLSRLAALALLAGCAPAPLATRPELRSANADLLVPGVTRELARHRAATISDVRYTLELDVRPSDHVLGAVRIDLTRAADAGDLILDFRGRSLDEVRANGQPVADAVWSEDHVRVPARHFQTGSNEVRLRFSSPVAAAGAAVIAFDEPADSTRYLYTLLVPSDAQLLFPVFDQPDIKARFTWIITTPAGSRALANGALREKAADESGGVRWSFHETPPISTYLAAFAAGPWHEFGPREEPRERADADDVATATRLLVRRSRADEVDADTLLALNRNGLRWLERYFDTRYPFDKMDLLLAPAFPFGGMEHVGAIFYNESNFIFREPPTLIRRLGRGATIYHEVAHQWFGDLVTMEWFDDLWLKEGFATFMAARMQADLHPESGAWKTFYLRNKPSAYGVDVTAGTTPVWQELSNLDLAKSNYGPIVYNKAPSILKQLEFLVGEAAFRRGLQSFLREHAYGNATWRDLLDAVAASSGTDLGPFGEQYILRAGLPLVETGLVPGDDGTIRSLDLVQRPARVLPGDPGGWWPGRVRVRLGYASRPDTVIEVSFAGERTIVAGAAGLPLPDYVFPNDGDFGYGIFLPDERSAGFLLRNAGRLEDELARVMAWGALWDLVREARLPPERFVRAALPAFDTERDDQIAGLLLGRIAYALERYLPAGEKTDSLALALESLLMSRVDDASLSYDLRKASLDALLGNARSAGGRLMLERYLAGDKLFDGEPIRPPSRWSAITRLLALDHPGARQLFAREQARDSTPEAPRLAFIAGAAIPEAENKAEYWRRYFEDEALNEEWVTASLAGFDHDLHAALTLPHLRPALEQTIWLRDNRRIFFLPRWLDAFIGGHASAEALRIVDDFLATHPELPLDVKRKILQPRDELERAVRIRAASFD